MTRPQATESTFVDALSGTDAMADPPPPRWHAEVFEDALGAPRDVDTVRIEMPEVPVPELPSVEELRRRVRDHDLPPVELTQAATSAERAAAARQAMAARRDAAVGGRVASSDAVPGVAPAPAAAQAPMIVARSDAHSMPLSYPAPSAGTAVSLPAGPARARRAGSAAARQSGAVPARPSGAAATRQRTPPSAFRSHPRQRTGGIWGLVVAVILFLVVSGAGKELLDAIMQVVDQ